MPGMELCVCLHPYICTYKCIYTCKRERKIVAVLLTYLGTFDNVLRYFLFIAIKQRRNMSGLDQECCNISSNS